jgi:hypothetical protein
MMVSSLLIGHLLHVKDIVGVQPAIQSRRVSLRSSPRRSAPCALETKTLGSKH